MVSFCSFISRRVIYLLVFWVNIPGTMSMLCPRRAIKLDCTRPMLRDGCCLQILWSNTNTGHPCQFRYVSLVIWSLLHDTILAQTEPLISAQRPVPGDDLHERMQSTGKLVSEVSGYRLYRLLITSPPVTLLWTDLLSLGTEHIFRVSQRDRGCVTYLL